MTDPDKPSGEPDEEPAGDPEPTERPTLTTDDEAQGDDPVIDPGNS